MSGRKRVLVALVALATALTAGGCSGDDDDNDDESSTPPRSFFGVVSQTGLTEQDLDRMGEARIGTLRLVVPWDALDPTEKQSEGDFLPIDGVVLGAARNGIDVLPTIYATPAWVARDLDGYDCEDDCAIYAPRSDEALAAWGDFVERLVRRYGPDGKLWSDNPDVDPRPIHAWQIWNEQNSPTFYQPAPDVEAYERLLATSADVIREHDPEATIVTGGMFGTPFQGERPAYTAWDFLRRLYEIPGAAEEFDGVGAHPYAAHLNKVESQATLIHDEIERAGDDASMWVTEVGWASSGPDVPLNAGPEGQAEALTDAFEFFLAKRVPWDVKTVTWYSWQDSPQAVCDWCRSSGLFAEGSLDPKPSWDAFLALTGGS